MSKKLTHEEFLERVKQKHGNSFTVLSEYINGCQPIKVRHEPCKTEYTFNQAKTLLKVSKCKKCNYADDSRVHNKLTIDIVKNEVLSLSNGRYSVLSDTYVNNKEKLIFLHHECNRTFPMAYNKFKSSNRRCPHCNISNGEMIIEEYLRDNNIKYQREYKLSECKNIRNLRFDFYIPSYDIYIEFDGKQHFEPSFGRTKEEREETLRITKERDKIKDDYCKENNLNLLRISYKDMNNIKNILDEYLKKFNDYPNAD